MMGKIEDGDLIIFREGKEVSQYCMYKNSVCGNHCPALETETGNNESIILNCQPNKIIIAIKK